MNLLQIIIVSSCVFFVYMTIYRVYSTAQFKKAQENQRKIYRSFQEKLVVGQRVLFGGGLSGTIVSMKDEWVRVELSKGVTLDILKGAITDVL